MKLLDKQKSELKKIVRQQVGNSPYLDFVDWCIERDITPTDATRMLDGMLVIRTAGEIMKPVLEKIHEYEENQVKNVT